MSAYRTARLLLGIRRAEKESPIARERRRSARVGEAVAHARTHSRYYREFYRDLPEATDDVTRLPVTDKNRLMARFDDWVTDPEVTLDRVRAFVGDPSLVGTDFLGRYRVATTSGSSGMRGLFVYDGWSRTVMSGLSLRSFRSWLSLADIRAIVRGGRRIAWVVATGGHFASSTVLPRSVLTGGDPDARLRAFSVFTPLPELVEQLNTFRPNILVGYAGQLSLLASEQEAGRLRVSPRLVMVSAEGLPESGYERLARVFGATVGNGYSASEFMSAAVSCRHGWLHVNSDWVVLEPVDADHRPVPPGEPSHTVLLTNLANRVQPVLRYDLGDSVVTRPDPCPCGSRLQAIRVSGRTAETLTFHDAEDRQVAVLPGALALVVDETPGLELAQVVQTGRKALRVRMTAAHSAEADRVWDGVRERLRRFLDERGLPEVTVERDQDAPQRSEGGKYRLIIPFDEPEKAIRAT